jgi:hypothetical protein
MSKRLPHINEMISVFAVISAMAYGWTLLAFLWKLPSWLKYLTLGEILTVYSYSLLTNFAESIFCLAFILILCVILPPRFLRDVFILRGTILALSLLGTMMLVLSFYSDDNPALMGGPPAWLVILSLSILFMLLLDFLSRKLRTVAPALLWLADRLMIFLYINLPLTLFALVVVAVRNLGWIIS